MIEIVWDDGATTVFTRWLDGSIVRDEVTEWGDSTSITNVTPAFISGFLKSLNVHLSPDIVQVFFDNDMALSMKGKWHHSA